MKQENYVSFETAKLLKEKGFDECPLFRYDDCGHLWVQGGYNKTIKWHFPAPTLQMAMKWLLKKHNIFICPLFLEESNGFGYTIENIIKKEYITTSKNSSYKEPEETCETAIKYCLENLI